MVIDGTTTELTVIVMLFDWTVAGETHAALLVITHVMTSLLSIALLVYVLVFDPTFEPFFFH
jgi:hypothetical protein